MSVATAMDLEAIRRAPALTGSGGGCVADEATVDDVALASISVN